MISRFYHLLGVIDASYLTRGKKLSIMQINVRFIYSAMFSTVLKSKENKKEDIVKLNLSAKSNLYQLETKSDVLTWVPPQKTSKRHSSK